MNPKDNIEQFFQNRLQASSPEEEAWNVPSDDLWNKAKVHFPKEEKKKRPFFFFLWGGAVLSVVAIALVVYLFSDKVAAKITPEDIMIQKDIAILNSDENEKGIKYGGGDSIANSTPLLSSRVIKESELSSRATKESNLSSRAEPTLSVVEGQESRDDRIDSFVPHSLGMTAQSLLNDTLFVSQSNENENLSAVDKVVKNKLLISSKDIILSTPTLLEDIMAVENLPTLLSSVEGDKKAFNAKTELKFIKPRRSFKKWEIGLSFSPFIINPEWLVEVEETDPGESYDLKMGYSNINVPISRRLSRRFSLTSGISLAKLDIDFGFEAQEVYNDNDSETELRDIINDSATEGSLVINDESSDVEIVFKPDANLMDGDSLLVKGAIPIKLQIAQVPFLVNYHFGKRKLEGLIHAGFGLDYFYGEIVTVDLEAFHENQLVTDPVVFEPVRDSEFGYSLYFGAGMKYHFTDRFNIGLSTKLDFTELLLSRHEIGIYYRF